MALAPLRTASRSCPEPETPEGGSGGRPRHRPCTAGLDEWSASRLVVLPGTIGPVGGPGDVAPSVGTRSVLSPPVSFLYTLHLAASLSALRAEERAPD